jgi:hypothetical protein
MSRPNCYGTSNSKLATSFTIPNGAINNLIGFGTVSGARDRRIMQLAMRFVF